LKRACCWQGCWKLVCWKPGYCCEHLSEEYWKLVYWKPGYCCEHSSEEYWMQVCCCGCSSGAC
jgi:hypothetical protein